MKKNNLGSITPAILIISSTFIVAIYALLLLLAQQLTYSNRQYASDVALNIAEAGVNYYRWHLAHDPVDFQDGTGSSGPYEHEYFDPQGDSIGYFSLEIGAPENGSSIVTIRSTGWAHQYPTIKRTIEVQYGIPSFARYGFLTSANTWYGAGITVTGDIHSNGGIRMDGTNTSLVSSALQTYHCGTETGCFPPQVQPGIWGSGGDSSLWRFPSPPIDFDTVSFDFQQMKSAAQNGHVYLPPSNREGYRLILQGDQVRIERVTRTSDVQGYRPQGEGLGQQGQGGCRRIPQIVSTTQLVGTYSLSENSLIFVEDDVWISGNLNHRVTVVAAGFPTSSSRKNIWITGNITYSTYDGSVILGLIAQNDIMFARDLPNNFQIDAALMAQKGRIMRHGYYPGCGNSQFNLRNSLTINGALISFENSYWNYDSPPISGFINRTINYDADLMYAPPPFFPTSGEYEFISWKEE